MAPKLPSSPAHSALYSDNPPSPSCCFCFRRTPNSPEQPFGTPPTPKAGQVENEVENTHQQSRPTIPSNVSHESIRTLPPTVGTVYDLPPGWKPVTSRTRPDRTAYMNEFTLERISWVPTEPASTMKGEIKRYKKRSSKLPQGSNGGNGHNTGNNGGGGGGATGGDGDSQYSSGSDRTVVKDHSVRMPGTSLSL